jgi:hypothetical protein
MIKANDVRRGIEQIMADAGMRPNVLVITRRVAEKCGIKTGDTVLGMKACVMGETAND